MKIPKSLFWMVIAFFSLGQLYAQPSCSNPAPIIQSEFLATCQEPPNMVFPLNSSLNTDDSYTPLDCILACANSTITYFTNAEAGHTYVWEVFGEDNSTILGAGNIIEVEWGAAGIGMVRLTEINGDCSTTVEECVFIIESPIAGFTTVPLAVGGQIEICLNDDVIFQDQSAGEIYSWFWDFGDGTSSNESSPIHQYSEAGTYTAVLTVYNSCGCSSMQEVTVIVDAAQAPEIACISTECQFSESAYSVTNACSGATYQWSVVGGSFTGGTTSTDATVMIDWDDPANGQGYLTVTVLGCDLCPIPSTVVVPILTDVLQMSGPEIVCLNDYTLYAIPPQPGNTFTWSITPYLAGFIPNPKTDDHSLQVEWTQAGTYVLELTSDYATLSCPDISPAVLTKTITVLSPFALAYPTIEACENESTEITANGDHTDGGGTGLIWEAIDENGNVISLPGSANTLTISSYQLPAGHYEIRAYTTSTGVFCNEYVTGFLTIKASAAAISASAVDGPTEVCTNSTQTYSATAENGNYLEWEIQGGYFNGDPGTTSTSGGTVTVTWTTGPFMLSIKQVTSLEPHCDSEITDIIISEIAATPPNISGPSITCSNSNFFYSASPTDNITSYNWSIAPAIAGSIVSGQNSSAIQVQMNDFSGLAAIYLNATICETVVSSNFLTLVGNPAAISIMANDEDCQNNGVSFSIDPVPGNPVNYQWDFGDGSTSTAAAPTHVFDEQGSFAVSVIVTYTGGPCSGQVVDAGHVIDIKPTPLINITGTPGLAICPPDINFTTLVASIQPQPGSGTMGYDYQWSGGNTPSQSTTTVFSPGTYYLTVSDPVTGCSSVESVVVAGDCDIPPPCSGVNMFSNQVNCNTFNFTSILSGDWDNPVWYFGDGTSSTQANPTHTYTSSGYYTVLLLGYNDNEEACAAVQNIVVHFVPDFIWEFVCNGSNEVETHLINQTDFILSPSLTYSWTFPGGTSSNANPVVSLNSGTPQEVTLQVSDGNETCDVTYFIDVPEPVNANFTHNAPQCEGNAVSFSSNFSGPFNPAWDFGDGATSNLENPQRTYAYTGTDFTVTLTATDAWGCSAVSSQTIEVFENTLTGNVMIIDTDPACEGASLQLGANISGGVGPLVYSWESADGSLDLGSNPTSDPISTSGDYILEVVDGNGCWARSPSESVLIFPDPEAFIIGESDLCFGEAVRFTSNQGDNYNHDWQGTIYISNHYAPNLHTSANNLGANTVTVLVTDDQTGCSDLATHNFTIHDVPQDLNIDPDPSCAPAELTASVTSSGTINYSWSNGTTGNTTTALTGGTIEVIAYNEAGCQSTTDAEVSSGPDLADVAVGCYCFPSPVSWYAPEGPGYTYQWYLNGVLIPGATTVDFLIEDSGIYQVEITDFTGCSSLSDDIVIDIGEACAICDFEVQGRNIECIGDDNVNGGTLYEFTVLITNHGSSLSGLTGTSTNGIVHNGSLSTTSLPGAGSGGSTTTIVTGTFTLNDGASTACITFYAGGDNGIACEAVWCITKFPDCGREDCNVKWYKPTVECFFSYGKYNYYTFSIAATNFGNTITDLVWYPCHSPYVSITTSTSTFNQNTSTLVEGIIMAESTIPNDCFYVCGYDTRTRERCCWLVNIKFPECPSTQAPCKAMENKTSKLLCAPSSTDNDGNRIYDFSITVYSPIYNGDAQLLPLWGQQENHITDLDVTVAGNYYTLTGTIVDIPPFDGPICFNVITSKGYQLCWMKLCLKRPNCQNVASADQAFERREETTDGTTFGSFKVQPNPATDQVNLAFDLLENAKNRIQVTSINGQILREINVLDTKGQLSLDIADLRPGMYLVLLKQEGQVIAQEKLIVLE